MDQINEFCEVSKIENYAAFITVQMIIKFKSV